MPKLVGLARQVLRAPRHSRGMSSFFTWDSPAYPEESLDLKTLAREQAEIKTVPPVNPADQYLEKSEDLHRYGRYIMSCLPKYVQQFSVWKDELAVCVPPSGLIPTVKFLRDHTAAQYRCITDITTVDFPSRENRFEMVYIFTSIRYNSRIRVKTYASETSVVPSLARIYEGANWLEREAYDMFGVYFEGHPDLRRILTDYGFEGHPLRKDFPLSGYTEVRYDEEKRRVVYEPVELTQAFRNFSAGSTAWEPVGPGRDDRPASFKLPEPEPEPEPEAPKEVPKESKDTQKDTNTKAQAKPANTPADKADAAANQPDKTKEAESSKPKVGRPKKGTKSN